MLLSYPYLTFIYCHSSLFIFFKFFGFISTNFARGSWFACRDGMAHAQASDERDGLKLWRVTLNIYWMSSRGQPTRCGLPAGGLGVGLTASHRKRRALGPFSGHPLRELSSLLFVEHCLQRLSLVHYHLPMVPVPLVSALLRATFLYFDSCSVWPPVSYVLHARLPRNY
jgi:hypothetical protein